jgi:hypothetical protein
MRNLRTAFAGACAGALLLAACTSGPAPLSAACKTALANERTVVGGNNRAVAALNAQGYNTASSLLPTIWKQDTRALKAVAAACPGTVQVVGPA